jgi:hypothetical protein
VILNQGIAGEGRVKIKAIGVIDIDIIVVKEIAVSVIHRIHLGKDIINDFVFIFPPCTYNVKILSVILCHKKN